MKISKNYDRAWAEIDLSALLSNARSIRRFLGNSCQIAGVVKADAYGHGAVPVSKTLLQAGYDYLAVASIDEALELRRHGIKVPIMILGFTDPQRYDELLKCDLIPSVFNWESLENYDRLAKDYGRRLPIQIKIDTGMGRLGFSSDFGTADDLARLKSLEFLEIKGIFTHFAGSDLASSAPTEQQFKRFQAVCQNLSKQGLEFGLRHCCNSAATLRFPSMHLDLVRVGLINYGLTPDYCSGLITDLRPVMQLKTKIVMMKQLEAGSPISYGGTYVTKDRQVIATIPVGYADGYKRIMSNRAEAIVHGRRVPVVGNICMDMCMLDLSGLPEEASVGDEVVLLGEQTYQGRRARIDANDLATWQQTINYEVVTTIGKRVPRVYTV